MKILTKMFSVGLLLSPMFVFAGGTGVDFSWFTSLAAAVTDLVGLLIPLAIAIGLLLFIWGLVQYIASSGDEGAKDEGKRKMIWGVIALFVIVSVWGIVTLMGEIFGIGADEEPPGIPGVTATN
jgi:hypothetical protein